MDTGQSPSVIVLIGVAGSGKSTIGRLLADRLGIEYADGDSFHPAANVAKMTSGRPLTDEERRPWLAAVAAWIEERLRSGRGGVVSCSALKRRYREALRQAEPGVWFLYLDVDRETVAERLALRTGHFMPGSLTASQFEALEPLDPDEPGGSVDARMPREEVVETAVALFRDAMEAERTGGAPVPATAEAFRLAESPVWDAARRRLLWVDIFGGAVLEGELDGGRIRVSGRHGFDGMVGAVAVAADGSLLVAAQERLAVILPDGTRRDGPRIIPAGERRRLNDGGADPAGRFVVGTLSLNGPSEREVLVRVEADGRLTELDHDLTQSNGLAWSADGGRMYSVDTLRGTVFVRDYDAVTGAVGERRVHLRVEGGLPDGIALDAADHLWVAVWGAGEVRRYAPDGTLAERLAVPAPHTSSVAFAGEDLRTLVITTASAELDDGQRRAHPDSGRLFTARAAVPGLPVPLWEGPVPGVMG